MASKIVITPLFSGTSAITTIVLYPNKASALAGSPSLGLAAGRYIYTSWSIDSPGANQLIPYAGYANIDAKNMRGNTNKYTFNGYVVARDQTGDDNAISQNLIALLLLNKEAMRWSIKLDGHSNLTSARGAVIMNIAGGDIGDGSGARWPFTLEMQDLGRA